MVTTMILRLPDFILIPLALGYTVIAVCAIVAVIVCNAIDKILENYFK